MPFDAAEVARQIEASRSGVKAEAQTREDALELALGVYRAASETQWEQRIQAVPVRRWIASPLSPLHERPGYAASRPDYCVAATDSSYISPDKHRGSFCHLINVGRVMVRYGHTPAAEIDNTPNHSAETLEDNEEATSGRLLAAKCALRELQELLAWARQYRADLALVDGSLMQLVLLLSKDEAVQALMAEYYGTLRQFREAGVPVVGYVSQPASQMAMRAVRMLACAQDVPCEKRPAFDCTCRPLWSIDDGDLFWEMLDAGELSPVFEPLFSYMTGPSAQASKETVFTYLATRYEVARLEFPVWVWQDGLLDRAISNILHQCALGKGYPNALLLAHQYAALHNADRESYYFLLERAELMRKPTEKAWGKRMVGQAI